MKLIKRLEINGHAAAIYSCNVLDQNHVFTSSGDKFIAKWNFKTGLQENFTIKCDESVYKIKLINEKKVLAIGTSSGSLHIIDLIQKKEIKHFIQHKVAIFEIEENQIKNHFYITDAAGNLSVWNNLTFELILFLPLNVGKIRHIKVQNDGELLFLACQDGCIKIFETENFNEINSFVAHKDAVNYIEIFNNVLYSCGKDGLLKVWGNNYTLIKSIPAHNFGIYQLMFLNDFQNFITISRDKSIKLWDTEKLKVLQKLERKHGGHSHSVNSVSKVNENEFISVGDDKRIIFWELTF